jgi:hypothetical protein
MASVSRVGLVSGALTGSSTGEAKTLGPRAQKFIGYLNVSAINGATTLDAKLQHSADKVNWIDVVSFTQKVGTTGVEAKHESQFAVANQGLFSYVRGVVTLAGGVTTATVQLDLWYDEMK